MSVHGVLAMSLRTIVVDDELLSRTTLVRLLERYCFGEVVVLGSAGSAADARELILDLEPQLVFLDIEMPVENGFDLLRSLPTRNFVVVFVTAHDDYALRAFKENAIDYLLKPVDSTELKMAVAKVARFFGKTLESVESTRSLEEYQSRLVSLMGSLKESEPTQDLFGFVTKSGYVYRKLSHIVCIKAEGNYCHVCLLDGEIILVTKILKDIEDELPPDMFLRPHKSYLVNRSHIREYKRGVEGSGGILQLIDSSEIEVSRRRRDEILAQIVK